MTDRLNDAFPGMQEEQDEDPFPGVTQLDEDYSSETMRSLFTQLDRDVVGWRPEPGDRIGGTLKDIEDSEQGEFGSYPILIIETPSGRLVGIHAFHTVLKNAIERRYKRGTLRRGDEIAILYQGQIGEKTGTRDIPHMYKIAVNRP